MRAMILAAGEGRRMRPATLTVPKPLLEVRGKSLIEHQIARLKAAGFRELVINVAYLGAQIQAALGDGSSLGVDIVYSVEPEPLETAGAIAQALPLLGEAPFVLINSDVWTDYPLQRLHDARPQKQGAHLILVNNPAHHRAGDFALAEEDEATYAAGDQGFARVASQGVGSASTSYTFSGVSVICPDMIRAYPNRRAKFPLVEVLRWAATRRLVTAEVHQGTWMDIGTPERLSELERA